MSAPFSREGGHSDFVTGGPFGLHGFGRFAGLPSEDLQQHGTSRASGCTAPLGKLPAL